MMDIAILCAVSLLEIFIAWLYMSNRKQAFTELPKEVQDDEASRLSQIKEASEESEKEECAPQTDEAKAQASVKNGFSLKKPTGKQWLLLAFMALVLCGMSVELEIVYEKNILLHNMKMISLLAILFTSAAVDAKEKIIPNVLVLSGLVIRVGFWVAELILIPEQFLSIVKSNFTACLLVLLFFVVGVLLIRGGLGMGDIKLMLVMCLFQGFNGVVSSLFCSLFAVFVYAIISLVLRKKSRKDSVAFGPAILLGTTVSIFLTGM